jgi:hypothetical protein
MTALKLVAFDQADLDVISAHLQDAVVKVADMAYLPADRRFVMMVNRFDWMETSGRNEPNAGGLRRRTAVRFEHVLSANVQGFSPKDKPRVLSLLAATFEVGGEAPPGGHLLLEFSGGARIRLKVEAIEAEFRDIGAAWRTNRTPMHAAGEGGSGPTSKQD